MMSPVRMSRIESAVWVVLDFYEVFNQDDIAGMMRLISEDCIYENADEPDGTMFTGKAAITQFWPEYRDQKPRIHIKYEDVFWLGFRTIMRWRAEWEPDAGEKSYTQGVDIFHIENGLIPIQYSYIKSNI